VALKDIEKAFEEQVKAITEETDSFYKGVSNPDDAKKVALLCLKAKYNGNLLVNQAEYRAKCIKRDIEFVKTDTYSKIRKDSTTKMTEATVNNEVMMAKEVRETISSHLKHEKDAKNYHGLMDWIQETHLTFRQFSKQEDMARERIEQSKKL